MMHRKSTRWLTSFVLVTALSLATGCIQAPSSQASEQTTPTAMPTLAVQAKATYPVARGPIKDQVRFDGRVVPVAQQELFFKVGGRVRKVYAKENDTVKAGQLLADLTLVDDLASQQASKQLNLRRAQIQVDIGQNDLDLFKINTSRWTIGYDQQMAIRNSQFELAKINLEEASMGVQDISKSISDASILAPFDGQLLSFAVQEGQNEEAYKNVAVVADVTKLEISADVPTDALSKLSEGMPVSITDINQADKTLTGTIRRIPYVLGTSSSSDSTTVVDKTTRISLAASPAESGLKLGNAVQLTVVLQIKDNVLLLPSQAIRVFEGRNFVLIKNGNLQQRVDVKLGIKSDIQVEILDGLSEGQVVIAP
jgi:membrane fusion protein, macrolide-specific efflux system